MARLTLRSLLLAAVWPSATGFAIHDLTKAPFDPTTALGMGYIARVEPTRLTMMCPDCIGSPTIDVQLGRQDDGTEGRFRAGTTTVSQLETACRAREASCRIERLQVEPAVGWMSSYRMGAQFAHTTVVLRDGDLLTVRTQASDSASDRRNADAMVVKLVRGVVGL
ncbi:MAG: hypothetical protein IPF87_23140 [Gemmatimonadetes bacterium]|nr:hypothetical protein [Gemmatimonadota bacterium]MBK6458939.1 hypothetical protein [Gemmatimonadota bacterium]MBP9106574.1 hypothetical protein [Gemmatimonadaceae bacterium]